MNYLFRILVAAGVLALSACGGGGSNGGAASPPQTQNLQITISPATASTTPFSLVDMPIRVLMPNGTPVRDGTLVTVQVTPPSVAQVSSLAAVGSGSTDPVRYGERVTASTAAGVVNFRVHSRAVGSAIITVSAAEQNGGTLTGTNQTNVNVVAGPPRDPRLTVTSASTTLPANRFNIAPFLGSPYLADVAITWRRLNGELVTTFPANRENVVDVTVSPVLNTGGFSTGDDPETTDIDEFTEVALITAPVETNGGRAVVFLRSIDQPGTTTIFVSARDPDTDETIQAELPFTIVNGSPRLPASISLNRDGEQVYILGSGGTTADRFEAILTDGAGGLVPDPVSGSTAFNNLQAEIVGGAQGGEKLAGTNAAGGTVRDGTIKVRSFTGVAAFTYQAGTRAGLVTIRATVDRADNNVDNGIQDGVQVVRSLTVGDGRLFDLDITAANIRSIRVNPFSTDAELLNPQDPFSPEIPPSPNGTYSYTVSAIATDRFGAPVVPGTEIRFGLIDSPQVDAQLAIFGSDGNPSEGSTGFTAPTGAFQTQAGGVGPGDTVLVFGEESNGNRDLESARTVASVTSQTSLTTTYRFNFNDDTGVPVNNGAVLPYIIGRATDGNFSSVISGQNGPVGSFGSAAFTDFNGVARVTLNYGVTKLGRLSAIYAQGVGDLVNNSPELVTDVELIRYPGIAPGQLMVSPGEIAANRTVPVTACLVDRLRSGVQGIYLNFRFTNIGAGVGRVNGVVGPGTLTEPTGENGCVTVDVSTSGVVQSGATGSDPPRVVFETPTLAAAPQDPPPANEVLSDSADIIAGLMFLSATPERVTGDGGRLIDLVLTDASGAPVPGVLIVGSCTATGGATLTITTQPAVTNAQGRTQAVASGLGFDVTSGTGTATGVCTFTVAGSTVNDTVTWGPQNICDTFSPAVPTGCPSATLIMNITGTGNAGSIPSGLNCTGPGTCNRFFAPATTIQIVLSAAPTTFTCQPTAGPVSNFGTAATASVLMPAAGQTLTCNVTFP